MSAHVLLNLLNELGKRDKMIGLPSILSIFAMSINAIIADVWMLDFVYHMTLNYFEIMCFGEDTLRFSHIYVTLL